MRTRVPGRKVTMSAKLEWLIRIDALIRAGRYPNARSITEHFEVSERTVYDFSGVGRYALSLLLDEYCDFGVSGVMEHYSSLTMVDRLGRGMYLVLPVDREPALMRERHSFSIW